ncbi:MAG: sugar ABC transporter substrate-binding protein [Christensenellaceae bacterium]|nr:sugar ABC transporter substrate-binding protein [Christensenellaceae bacterium]
MKRILALLLTVALIASLGVSSAFAADDGFVDGKFAETRHITVEVFNRNNDGGTDPTNNVWSEYIQKEMLDRYNVEVEFVSVGRWTEGEDIANLLADGKAPDVSYTYAYNTVISYANMVDANGNPGVVDLAPYLEEYKDQLGNLLTLLGSEDNLYYDKDPETGAVWMIEGVRADTSRITTFIRKDWLDTLGLPLPTTEEEFYNALVAFRDNAETLLGADADKMIPYTISTDIGWRADLLSVSKVPSDVDDVTLFVYGYDDRHLLYPGYKEGIRVLNKWYNEGLIWKDFGLYNDSTVEDDNMKAGYVGAFMHNWDYPFRNGDDCINANLKRNVGEDAMFVPIDCFQNDAGVTLKFMGAAVGSDRKIFLPSTNTEPLASLLYINFISSVEAITYLQTGLEGTNHILHDDGAYEILPATGEWVMNSGNNIDYTMTCNGLYLGEATGATTALSYPGIPAEIVIQANEYGKNNGRYVQHFNVGTIESETEVGTSLTSLRDELLTKAVTASVADFDSVYDSYMADYMNAGGQDIIDERIEKLADVYGIDFEQ